jgi:TPR repeat protein
MGCIVAQLKSNMTELREGSRCPFCREPAAADLEESSRLMERVEANDPVAMRELGRRRYNEGEYDSAFDYYTKAAETGDIDAHFLLGQLHVNGEGVEIDENKVVYFLEQAAIGGHTSARYILALAEWKGGKPERSVRHFIIAAKLGCELSMKDLWKHYSAGNITKEDLDATLRAHKAALDATKSSERTFAEAFISQMMESNR